MMTLNVNVVDADMQYNHVDVDVGGCIVHTSKYLLHATRLMTAFYLRFTFTYCSSQSMIPPSTPWWCLVVVCRVSHPS